MDKVNFKGINITEEQRQFTKVIDGDSFTVKVSNSNERAIIALAISQAIGGQPITSVDPTEYENIKRVVTLCNVVVKGPDWWTNAADCPSSQLITELWRFSLESNEEFDSRLRELVKTKALGKK